MKAIKNVKIVQNGKILPESVLLFEERIVGVSAEIPVHADVTDGGGLYLTAGLIDQHIHGYGGEDTMTHDPANAAKALPANGVTAFLPTTMTMDRETIAAAMERIRSAMGEKNGARVLGCHMEGPFINPSKKGAQNGDYILPPTMEMVEPYKDVIKIVTYAPETDPEGAFAKGLRSMGIVPSVGHTSANYGQAAAAYEAGALSTTHFFNAMPPLHHRDPGVIGAALECDAYIELIADTIHVNEHLFPTLAKLKEERLCLITDCIEAGGLPDGQYALGGQPVVVKDRRACLLDGTLAGSTLKLNEGVRNMAKYVGLPAAVQMATENPARLLGLDSEMGTLLPGTLADFVLMDEECNVYATFVGGECVYVKE
ncbi:MAG: N-acetylglucosamine-6-phosphate deacetylase [Clostridia bacterium]|nr:N-acetylglucosamine-6-phosphate deacetylase [Clostridia bacterium]